MPKEEPIHLDPYSPKWPAKFEKEKHFIENTLGSWIHIGVEHVGSTAIPGVSAKPIIDIMVGVKNLEEAKALIPLLEQTGYKYFPYKPELMHWFCKPSPEHREFHLYLMEPNHAEWQALLAFRNYLRTHPDKAKEYVDLKTKLANRFKNDRETYTQAKTEFIRSAVAEALRASSNCNRLRQKP